MVKISKHMPLVGFSIPPSKFTAHTFYDLCWDPLPITPRDHFPLPGDNINETSRHNNIKPLAHQLSRLDQSITIITSSYYYNLSCHVMRDMHS